MIGDPFGFDMVNDPVTQEQVKLTKFTPQITFMTTMWIVEYCTHHGIPMARASGSAESGETCTDRSSSVRPQESSLSPAEAWRVPEGAAAGGCAPPCRC